MSTKSEDCHSHLLQQLKMIDWLIGYRQSSMAYIKSISGKKRSKRSLKGFDFENKNQPSTLFNSLIPF